MRKRLPALESLRVLESCVRHGSFTRAADEIGVTAAAVSLRIRNLEAELGTRLFSRSGPRLQATDAAIVLAARVGDALREMQMAVGGCRGDTGPLRVTAPPSFASRWLAPRLARYHRRADAVPIRVDCSAELRAGDDFDVAIRTGLGAGAEFVSSRLLPVEVTPMLSPSPARTVKPSSPADLAKLPLLAHDELDAAAAMEGGRRGAAVADAVRLGAPGRQAGSALRRGPGGAQ